MHIVRLLALAGATATLFGCSSLPDLQDSFMGFDMDRGVDMGVYGQEANVQGRLAGTMPEVGTFEEEAGTGYAYRDDYWMNLELHANGDYGWAMVQVYAQIDENGDVVVEPESVIGCTGPEEYWADFDEPATDAQITIDTVMVDGELVEVIEIEAEWEDGNTIVAVAELPPVGE